jgi:hypothetical protein
MRRAALLALSLLALLPAAAPADGDPASDVLLAQDAYYPYAPKTSRPLARALDALLKDVRAAGYPMKVALIETPADLGAYPNFFNDPQRYAGLLASEISFNARPHLLIVMPTGFAGSNLGAKVDSALAGITIDQAAKSDGLVKAALTAVAHIASFNGHPTPVPAAAATKVAPSHASSNRSTPSLLVYGGPVLLVAIAILALLFVSRRREGRDDEPRDAADEPAG